MRNGTLHFTPQTADILLLQSSNVMRKLMSVQHLLRKSSIHYNLYQRGIQWHCILHHGQQATCSTSLLAACQLGFFKFVKFVTYSYHFLQGVFFGVLLHQAATGIHICFTYMQHYYLQKCVCRHSSVAPALWRSYNLI